MENKLISVVVLSKDEESNIGKCLESVDWADEVIVVDDESTDKTVEIAKKYTPCVYINKKDDFASQRNFALQKVNNDWVFFVDADERITDELKDEILLSIKKDEFDGFYIPRKSITFGKWIKNMGWYPNHILRLFKKEKGRFLNKVHELAEVNGRIGYLQNPIFHYNYTSISDFINRLDIFTHYEAEKLIDENYKFDFQDLITEPFKEFGSRFFQQKGYKDGIHGLILSLLLAFYRFITYIKVWEKLNYFKICDEGDKFKGKVIRTMFSGLEEMVYRIPVENGFSFFEKFSLRIKKKISLFFLCFQKIIFK